MNSHSSSGQEILDACEAALQLAPEAWPETLPASAELFGAHEWHRFELEAWSLGESARQVFLRHPSLKKQRDLVSKVVQVATCRNLRRGRQSFVMALAFVAARPHAKELAPFLNDEDVCGHVVDTLLKMKAAGFAEMVMPLLGADRAWIRKLARKYVDRYPP